MGDLIARARRILHHVSCLALALLMFLTVADVVGRYLFNRPITGTYELTGLIMVAVVFLALGYAHQEGDHITIDLVYARLPRGLQVAVSAASTLLVAATLALIMWGLYGYADRTMTRGSTTSVLRLPIYPFVWVALIGALSYAAAALGSVAAGVRNAAKAPVPRDSGVSRP